MNLKFLLTIFIKLIIFRFSTQHDCVDGCNCTKGSDELKIYCFQIQNSKNITLPLSGNITKLVIEGNFTSIPSNICQFKQKLKVLIFKNNLLENIGYTDINCLTELTDLDLSNNKITFLHDNAFGNLKKLERFNIAHNYIDKLPSISFQFIPIIYANFSFNELKSFPLFNFFSNQNNNNKPYMMLVCRL